MATVAELMQATLMQVFNERDDAARRAVIARIYAPDVTFSDPDEVVTGHEALNAKAGRLLADSPGMEFHPMGPVLVNHDLGYLTWGLGPRGGEPVVRGVDIGLIEDGFIKSLHTLLLTD